MGEQRLRSRRSPLGPGERAAARTYCWLTMATLATPPALHCAAAGSACDPWAAWPDRPQRRPRVCWRPPAVFPQDGLPPL